MITLYAFATPNNLKVAILLEELGLSYEIKPVNIRAGEQKADAFLALNLNGKVPVIVDSEGPNGELVLAESAAILVYRAEKSGRFIPEEGAGRYRVFEQLFFHASGVSPAFGNSGYFQKLAPQPVPEAIERFHNEALRLAGLLDKVLSQQDFVAGYDLTIADIAHFGWMWRSAFAGLSLANTPHLNRWYENLAARPAFQSAIKKVEALVPKP